MDELIALILEVFAALWAGDERPEARRFTIGCAGVVIVAAFVLWLVFRR